MKPILTTIISLFIFSSCTNDDDNREIIQDLPVRYYFAVSSVLDVNSEEDKIYEIEIDGVKFTGKSPESFYYEKKTNLPHTHVKFNLKSRNKTNIVYQVYKDELPNYYDLASGSFRDQLDTIIKINK